jgi:dolichyl-diphosphooligosaccharide--protein glycosyltransferase
MGIIRKAIQEKLTSSSFQANPINIVIIILICLSLSAVVRFNQYKSWKKFPQRYFINEIPMMSTLDAYSWLRYSREYKDKIYNSKDRDTLRYHPDFMGKPNPVPMLSFLIARLSGFFDNNLYKTAMYMIPILASLFIIPLSLYFFKLGYPASAIIGSFIGTFNFMYYTRTSIGRVDTDLLNLFFPLLASLLILNMSGSKRKIYILSALCGLTMFLFYWWYFRPAFSVIYLFILVSYLWINKIDKGTILLSSVIYITIANVYFLGNTINNIWLSLSTKLWNSNFGIFVIVSIFITFLITLIILYRHPKRFEKKYFIYFGIILLLFININYFKHALRNIFSFLSFYLTFEQSEQIVFPSMARTITEAQHVPVMKILSYIINDPLLSLIGFVFFFILTLAHWKKVIPLIPVILLGLLAFQTSQRFSMYLAPFIGVGYGYLITLLLTFVFEKFSFNKLIKEVTIYVFSFLLIFVISKKTAISFVPSPSIPVDIYSAFLDSEDRLPEDAVLFTWWDFGFALQDATRLATFHDGGSQENPKTYFIARGLASKDQKELYRIISFINNKGGREIGKLIKENESHTQVINQVINYDKLLEHDSIYLLFTRDMIGKFSAISYLGNWDFEEKSSKSTGFNTLRCQGIQKGILKCSNATIDIGSGLINDRIPLKKTFFVDNGSVVKEISYNHGKGVYLQILLKENRIYGVYLLNERVFRSNFNQIYLLGRIDKNLYEEVYNTFPAARIFRLKKGVH